MSKIDVLKNKIEKIGISMPFCENYDICRGINFSTEQGVYPRCLHLETEGRDLNEIGCVVIGLNPGTIMDKKNGIGYKEREHFRNLGFNRDSLELEQNRRTVFQEQASYFKSHTKSNVVYYRRINALLSFLEIKGPILWTELVKCECPSSSDGLIKSTVHKCATKYLFKELDAVPNDWIVFALGDEIYRYLLLRESINLVGLPHPSQMHGKVNKESSLKMDIKNLMMPDDDEKSKFTRTKKEIRIITQNREWLKFMIQSGQFPFQCPIERK